MTIVVLIVGLMAAVSMPRVLAVQRRNQLRNAAMTLTEHLRLARETAMSRAMPVDVVFTTTNAASYQIPTVRDPEFPASTVQVNLRNRISQAVTLQATFNGVNTLQFGVDGLPRAAGQPVTTSNLTLTEGTFSESIQLLHGWGTAKWKTAGPGSTGTGP